MHDSDPSSVQVAEKKISLAKKNIHYEIKITDAHPNVLYITVNS